MLLLVSVLIVAITALYLRKCEKREKIFGVYTQPGALYPLKYLCFYVLIWARRFRTRGGEKDDHEKKRQLLETLRPLSEHENAFDATFFQAVTQDGLYLCGGIERRHHGKANGLFYLVVPELGLLESLKLPNTLLETDPASVLQMRDYAAEGIRFGPVEPMRVWHLSFDAKMRSQADPNRTYDVKMSAEWTSDWPYFLFEDHVHIAALSRAMAREEWTRDFFGALKSAHQTHYEQMGFLQGTLSIDGREYPLKMDAFRDHSFGHKRDWSLMHRYAFHMLYLANGARVCVGVVSQPCTTSQLEMGYAHDPKGALAPIQSCDLLLYQHGETGRPPKDYSFCFKAGRETFEARISVVFEAVHYKGLRNEARLHERFVECEVNGIGGRGISEWQYNTKTNRC